jgi:hypothetical protein
MAKTRITHTRINSALSALELVLAIAIVFSSLPARATPPRQARDWVPLKALPDEALTREKTTVKASKASKASKATTVQTTTIKETQTSSEKSTTTSKGTVRSTSKSTSVMKTRTTPRLVHAPFTFWLAPPISSAGTPLRLKTNFAMTLGASAYAELEGMDLAFGASIVLERMHGIQASMGLNIAGPEALGVQTSVGLNIAKGRFRGLQQSVGFNHVAGDLRGAQIAVGYNFAGRRVHGLQTSVGFNYAHGDLQGLQVSAGANVARCHVNGAQISSGVNVVGSMRGAQIGIINIGGDIRGAQIGLINIARVVSATQIGLVNISKATRAPIGLVNIVEHGVRDLELWSSDTTLGNIGFKWGGTHLYTIIAAGFQPKKDQEGEHNRWMLGLGFGARGYLTHRLSVDVDLMSWHVNDTGDGWTDRLNLLNQLRAQLGISLAPMFSLFVGATLNVRVSHLDRDDNDMGLIAGKRLTRRGADVGVWMWPGIVAGLRF